MDFIAVYPKIEPKPNAKLTMRLICSLLLLVGCLTVGIVNLCLGGDPWCLYVFGGVAVFWAVFLYHPLVQYSFIQKITVIFFAICGYLILLDALGHGTHWSKLVVPIVLFSLFLLTLLLFFTRFKKQKHNVLPLYWIFFFSLAVVIIAACGVFSMTFSWPIIILAVLDFLLLLLSFFFFRRPIGREFAKKFHLS